MIKQISGVIVAGLLVCLPAAAPAESVNEHQQHQENRIEKGERKGQLTDGEAGKLDAKQDAIEREREQAWSDGKMNKREHKSIRHEQKEANRDIHRMRSNKQGEAKD